MNLFAAEELLGWDLRQLQPPVLGAAFVGPTSRHGRAGSCSYRGSHLPNRKR